MANGSVQSLRSCRRFLSLYSGHVAASLPWEAAWSALGLRTGVPLTVEATNAAYRLEQTRGRLDSGLRGVVPPVSNERFLGVRLFDITDLKHPKQVAAVPTCRCSHRPG